MKEFDLRTENWIPCINDQHRREFFCLRKIFAEAHTLREIQGETPLVTVSLYRLLLALLHSIPYYQFKNAHEWTDQWKKELFDLDPINAYLDKWQDRFDLFHPKYPFYQDIETLGRPSKTRQERQDRNHDFDQRPERLMHEIASGNNAAWFDHTLESHNLSIDAPTAARALITTYGFGLSGTGAIKGSFSHAPLVNDAIFILEGKNLFETLMLNLYLSQNNDPLPIHEDCPVWERDHPFAPRSMKQSQELESKVKPTEQPKGKKKGETHVPSGYLDFLTWPSRRILLKCDEDDKVRWLKLDQGWKMEAGAAVSDPMKAYKENKESKDGQSAMSTLGWDETRVLWRDSTALFRLRSEYGKTNGFNPPKMIGNLHRLLKESDGALDRSKTFRCVAFGMCAGKTTATPATSAAAIHFFRAERMPLPLAYLDDESNTLIGRLDTLLKESERAGTKLVQAVRAMMDALLETSKEARNRGETKVAAQQVLSDWDAFLQLLDESQKSKVISAQNKRDEKLPQRGAARAAAEQRYWADVGEQFYEAMLNIAKTLPTDRKSLDDILSSWKSMVWRAAHHAFNEAADGLGKTARALKAYAKGAEIMADKHFGLNPPMPKSNKKEAKPPKAQKETTNGTGKSRRKV